MKQQQSQIQPKQSRPYITLEYNYTDTIRDIFMRPQTDTFYRMEKNGRVIYPKFLRYNKAFRDMFEKVGYNFVPEKRSYSKGKKKVFGIVVTVSKIEQKDKKIIRIKIEGTTVDEVTEKSRKLEREVRKLTHEDPEMRLWERLEMC